MIQDTFKILRVITSAKFLLPYRVYGVTDSRDEDRAVFGGRHLTYPRKPGPGETVVKSELVLGRVLESVDSRSHVGGERDRGTCHGFGLGDFKKFPRTEMKGHWGNIFSGEGGLADASALRGAPTHSV